MARLIKKSARVEAPGNKPKIIDEIIGRVNSEDSLVSIAHMRSPDGWEEPAQTPEFDEYTYVLKGVLKVETEEGVFEVGEGQAVHLAGGEWVRYSTPGADGAEYIAVCLPAFSSDTVHREEG